MLEWLPAPADFRGGLRAALECADPIGRMGRLVALAEHRLGFLETLQLDRAAGQPAAERLPTFVPIRLAILSSSTVDHLAPAIRVAGLRRRLLIDVHNGGFGQYQQDVLDPSSLLHQFAPQVILFSLSAREVI